MEFHQRKKREASSLKSAMNQARKKNGLNKNEKCWCQKKCNIQKCNDL